MSAEVIGLLLVIDTATRLSVVAVDRLVPPAHPTAASAPSAAPVASAALPAVSRRDVPQRHGAQLLEQLEEVLVGVPTGLDAVGAVAVGTGPGSFTGLRVGLATAKTLAHVRGLPLVAVSTTDTLRRSAVAAGAPEVTAIVMPAGAHDHYLARADAPPELIAPGALREALGDLPAATIDSDVLGVEAARLGDAALAGLPDALLDMARERLAGGRRDEAALLVPAYVALPRGIHSDGAETAWSPDLR